LKNPPPGNGQSNGAPARRRKGRSEQKSNAAVDAAADHRPSRQVRALLDSDFDPRVILRPVRDADGRILDFVFADTNEAACTYNGLTREELLGRRLLDLFPNSTQTGLFAMYCRTVETNQPLELRDFPYPHDLHGRPRRLHIRALPVGDDLHHTWRDVTEQAHPAGHNGDAPAPAAYPLALERRQSRHFSAEAESHIRDLQHLAQSLIESREQEHQDLSRELHDNIAQVLSAATARISLANEEPIPAWLRQELIDLRDDLRAALDDIRHLARSLRPALLDHLGFASALEKHADAFRERTRMTLDLHVQPEAASFLDNDGLTHLFRLTQEGLQNIEEHSGADRAWIKLQHNGHEDCIVLEIGDNGRSFPPGRVTEAQADGHLGLLGMRERAELLGGRFILEATPGQGTTIRVTLPSPSLPAQI